MQGDSSIHYSYYTSDSFIAYTSRLSHLVWRHLCLAGGQPAANSCTNHDKSILVPCWVDRNSSDINLVNGTAQHRMPRPLLQTKKHYTQSSEYRCMKLVVGIMIASGVQHTVRLVEVPQVGISGYNRIHRRYR